MFALIFIKHHSKMCSSMCKHYSKLWLLSWPIGSATASHQCGTGSIPGVVSEKGLSSPVSWATLRPWVGTLSHWPSLQTSANPIRETLTIESQHFSQNVGNLPGPCWRPVLCWTLITRTSAGKEPLCVCFYYYYYYDYDYDYDYDYHHYYYYHY